MRSKVSQRELEERREKVRRLLRSGLRPSEILKNLQSNYEGYKDPYATLRKDIAAVKKQDVEALRLGGMDEHLADYIGRLEELYQRAILDATRLSGTAKVGALNKAHEIARDLARAKGINPDKLDQALALRFSGEVGISREYHIIQELISDPDAAQALKQLYRRAVASGLESTREK